MVRNHNSPLFSVILPTHNGENRIGHAIASVTMQTCDDYELIVVCDSCTDNTLKYVENLNDLHIRIIKTNVHRDGLARNIGIDAAHGNWILFIDDDDFFLHEYVFEILQHTINKQIGNNTDIIDFSFICKNKGYCTQPPYGKHFSMVWCRAWKRSFIGDNRFNDSVYGSDTDFFNKHIKNNPECHVHSMNALMYYYNYNREGSLSYMYGQKKKAKVDLVITHYNEPWEVGKKLFDSIMLQECCDREDLNIILVQDGAEYALDWDKLLAPYQINVHLVTLDEHLGISAARNAGIDNAETEWIMFLDFDDMLADIATLSMFLQLFPPASDVDMIWSKYVREGNDFGFFDKTSLNCEDVMDNKLIGKAYRLSLLRDRNIRFSEEFPEYCDQIFNTLVIAETYAFRIFNFTIPFYPFYKKYRSDSTFNSIEALNIRISNQFQRNVFIMNEMKARDKKQLYNEWMVRTLADAYNIIRDANLEPEESFGITDELIEFWRCHKDEFMSLSDNDIEVVLDVSQSEAMNLILKYYNYFQKEYYLQNDMIEFNEFIQKLDQMSSEIRIEPIIISDYEPLPMNNHEEHVVVYCGTKETYVSMIASAKSLLATTPVDKIYFLIEDDVFPYELPDIIETRNVKDIGLYDPHGPNYNNAWTYMCLMRTAYPQMFPEYDKVLSLDIDVVITEDVSDLWNIDLTDYYFAGVLEQGRIKDIGSEMYANFGVIMMNLKKLREDDMGPKLIEAVNTEHFGCPEQDAFNKLCKGHIYQLPNDYNVTVYSHITGEAIKERILHYAGIKYWKHFGPVKKYNHLSWDEIMSLQEKAHG